MKREEISDKEFRKKYYSLIKSFATIERMMTCDRCPAMMKNCCAGCLLIKNKLKDIKNGKIYDEGESHELTKNDPRV